MKKQFLSLLILLFTMEQVEAQTGYWYANRNQDWASDYDKNENFVITSAKDLAQMAWLVNEGGKSFQGKTITLEPIGNNIDLSDNLWKPLGTNNNRFMGTFDGKKNTLSGVRINTEEDYIGFFGSLGSSGTIKNLHIIIADTGIKGGNRVGGLAGACYGEITNCAVSGGKITGLGFSIGGLVGSAYSGSRIKNSYAENTVKATTVTKLHIGGVVGYLDRGSVSNCYATGSVAVINAMTSDIGGLVGYQKEGPITKCYATGMITVVDSDDSTIGGLVGKQCDNITESHSNSEIICKEVRNSSVGELVGLQISENDAD